MGGILIDSPDARAEAAGGPGAGAGAEAAKRQIPSLTGIRGICAVWVLLFHVNLLARQHGYAGDGFVSDFMAQGWAGVDLFFILSGFILMMAHGREFVSITARGVGKFALLRCIRIYPVNIVILVLIAGLYGASSAFVAHTNSLAPGTISLRSFLETATLSTRWLPYVPGSWNEPVWSLSVEIVAYLFFPGLCLVANRIRSPRVSLSIAALLIACYLALKWRLGHINGNAVTNPAAVIRAIFYFAAGMFIGRAALVIERVPPHVASCNLLAALVLILLSFLGWGGVLPILFAVMIFCSYFGEGIVVRILSSRVAMLLGRISFSLYLFHAVPLMLFNYYIEENMHVSALVYWSGVALLSAVVVLLSFCIYTWIEAPFHMIARRAARRFAAAS